MVRQSVLLREEEGRSNTRTNHVDRVDKDSGINSEIVQDIPVVEEIDLLKSRSPRRVRREDELREVQHLWFEFLSTDCESNRETRRKREVEISRFRLISCRLVAVCLFVLPEFPITRLMMPMMDVNPTVRITPRVILCPPSSNREGYRSF